MADLKKYSFNKHSEKYKQLFNKEKSKLGKQFSRAKIEHVGSSSIIELGGKGIIDVAISVPKNQIQNAIKKLERNGYDFRPNGGDKERSFFQKIIKYKCNERRVHIQLTHSNSKTWKSMLAVRDYLRKNPKAIKEYE
ncbi:MAG: GrpB family protein, partial [Nanoarchaeota archaeon]